MKTVLMTNSELSCNVLTRDYSDFLTSYGIAAVNGVGISLSTLKPGTVAGISSYNRGMQIPGYFFGVPIHKYTAQLKNFTTV